MLHSRKAVGYRLYETILHLATLQEVEHVALRRFPPNAGQLHERLHGPCEKLRIVPQL